MRESGTHTDLLLNTRTNTDREREREREREGERHIERDGQTNTDSQRPATSVHIYLTND